MKNQSKLLFCAGMILLAISMSGCKKSTSTNTTSKANLLIGIWHPTSDLNNGVEVILDCEKDGTETYLSNGTYTFDKGPDDCSGAEDNKAADWQLIDNDTKVVYSGSGGSPDTVVIITLDEHTFKRYTTDDPTYIETLSH